MTDERVELPVTFHGDRDFEATRAAEQFLRDNECAYAPMQGGAPRGVMFDGDYLIAKWRNLTVAERKTCDAYMLGDGRHGPITITTTYPKGHK